ncbi:MAG: hypothetical protein SGJ20_11465 [Planctomycetota bacterium]|nr:hypothetical protein [Planctomycetota bacterium]
MALDVYVGGFSRYYSFQWENVAQRFSRESGMEYRMVGPGGPPQPADWNEVAKSVSQWKAAINEGLADNIAVPLEWDETKTAPYFTDRPGYDPYGALKVWTAHAERGTSPPELYSGEWYTDEAYIECSKPKHDQKYRAILCGSLWLPGDFEFSFDFENLAGEKAHICSNNSLLQSLELLRQDSFNLTDAELEAAVKNDSGDAPSVRSLAQFALWIFLELTKKSVTHHLPIVLNF